jgi:hypothetical protein
VRVVCPKCCGQVRRHGPGERGWRRRLSLAMDYPPNDPNALFRDPSRSRLRNEMTTVRDTALVDIKRLKRNPVSDCKGGLVQLGLFRLGLLQGNLGIGVFPEPGKTPGGRFDHRYCGNPTLCASPAKRGSERRGSSKKSVFKASRPGSRS